MADVGVRLAWGLLVGVVAQFLGAHLGQVPLIEASSLMIDVLDS